MATLLRAAKEPRTSEDEAARFGTCRSPVSVRANVAGFVFFFLETKNQKRSKKKKTNFRYAALREFSEASF